jgi:hypothetical protein
MILCFFPVYCFHPDFSFRPQFRQNWNPVTQFGLHYASVYSGLHPLTTYPRFRKLGGHTKTKYLPQNICIKKLNHVWNGHSLTIFIISLYVLKTIHQTSTSYALKISDMNQIPTLNKAYKTIASLVLLMESSAAMVYLIHFLSDCIWRHIFKVKRVLHWTHSK